MADVHIIIDYKKYTDVKLLPREELLQKHNFDFKELVEKEKIQVKRGDLVNFLSFDRYKTPLNWKNNKFMGFMYIIDKKDEEYFLVKFGPDYGSYGSLPTNFVLYQEPDYFTSNHWNENGKSLFCHHSHVSWLKTSSDMLENVYSYKTKGIILTAFTDCRGEKRKIFHSKSNIIEDKDIVQFQNIISKDVFYIYIDDSSEVLNLGF